MPRHLDFTALPSDSLFRSRSIFTDIPKELEVRLAPLPETLNRLKSAVMFAAASSRQSEPWRAAAQLRAALTDFCASEEMQKLDRPGEEHLRFVHSADPLIHLLELMRHLNIHVRSSEVNSLEVNASLDEQQFEMTTYVISNLDAHDLANLKNGKHYTPMDLQRLVDWFSKAQRNWGAGYVVRLGTEVLAAKLCSHYGL